MVKRIKKKWKFEHVKCTRVVDGDTIDCEVDMGNKTFWCDRFRLFGVDTPESYGRNKCEAGLIVKQKVKELLQGKAITLETIEKGKFGRFLCIVHVDVDGNGYVNVNSWLLEKGYAKEYYGGKKV